MLVYIGFSSFSLWVFYFFPIGFSLELQVEVSGVSVPGFLRVVPFTVIASAMNPFYPVDALEKEAQVQGPSGPPDEEASKERSRRWDGESRLPVAGSQEVALRTAEAGAYLRTVIFLCEVLRRGQVSRGVHSKGNWE